MAALQNCFEGIEQALLEVADPAAAGPDAALDRMGDAYVRLVADRPVLMLQVHAQSAAAVLAIGEAPARGPEHLILLVSTRTGAEDAAVQRFMSYGQLCHPHRDDPHRQARDAVGRLLSRDIRHTSSDAARGGPLTPAEPPGSRGR